MIKIAFCDDDLSVLRELGALMDKYRVERNQDIIYASFNSPLELLTEVERGTRLDIIFLDVLMWRPGNQSFGQQSVRRKIHKQGAYRVCCGFLFGRCLFLPVEAYLAGKFLPPDGFCTFGMPQR